MDPPRLRAMSREAYCMFRMAPVTLTSKTRAMFSGVIMPSRLSSRIPALFTNTSSRLYFLKIAA